MPITELPIAGKPLSQGDILKGIRLFLSRESPDAPSFAAIDTKRDLCLVLSRQCVVEHKKTLIVAAIDKYPKEIQTDLDFKGAELFLESIRAGNRTPDLFYLGQLPGMQGRYCGRLDSLHTVELPEKPDIRQPVIDAHRIARLNIDFVRDLHMRVLTAFGNMGFEDHSWLSDDDLKWLASKGESDILKEIQDQKTTDISRTAGGTPTDDKQRASAGKKLESLKRQVEPYAQELKKRFPAPPAAESAGAGGSESPA